MNNHSGSKPRAGANLRRYGSQVGAGLLLLGVAWLAQAAITITLDNGDICTEGTVILDVSGAVTAVTPVPASCSAPPPPGSFTLSVAKAGTGSGTVTSSPAGISCGGDCSEAYAEDTAVSLTATPASGSTFGGWSGACTGSGACNLSMTANRSVTATFTADAPPPGACGPLPPDVTVVDTGNLNTSWPTAVFSPAPAVITAFEVRVPAGFSGRGDFRATRIPPATAGKALVVSTCPGVLQPVAATACSKTNVTDSALIRLSANPADNQFLYCKLTAGQTYYVNAVSKTLLSDPGFNCSSTSNCRFDAVRGQPY